MRVLPRVPIGCASRAPRIPQAAFAGRARVHLAHSRRCGRGCTQSSPRWRMKSRASSRDTCASPTWSWRGKRQRARAPSPYPSSRSVRREGRKPQEKPIPAFPPFVVSLPLLTAQCTHSMQSGDGNTIQQFSFCASIIAGATLHQTCEPGLQRIWSFASFCPLSCRLSSSRSCEPCRTTHVPVPTAPTPDGLGEVSAQMDAQARLCNGMLAS